MPPRGYRKEKPTFKCELCSYTSQRQSCFTDHLRVHSGEKPFQCGVCGKSFTQKSNLGQHLKVHGAGAKHEFKCTRKGCNFTSKWKSSLLIHERWHDGERPYQCTLCEKTFTQSTHCRTHMRESHGNERKFQCEKCSKCFKRSDHLTRHMAFHKAEKNFACEVCGKRFIDMGGLRSHRRIHEGEAGKRYKCDKCPYKSFFKQCLDVHYRIHLGLKPYECDHCSKTFRTSSSVKIHIRMVHQGEEGKIFSCELCSFSTANKQSLKNHHRRIHLGYKERAWLKCLACGKVYTTRSSYYSHRRKRHPKLPRVEDIYRRGQKIHSGIGNKHTTDKSQLSKEGAGGKLTTNRRTGGKTGEGTKSTKRSALANNPNIAAKDVVNIKTKGDTIENITIRLPGAREAKKRKKSAVKVATMDEGAMRDAEKLKDVANIVDNLKKSPKSKLKKSSKSKEKDDTKTKAKVSLKVKLKKPKEKHKKVKTRKTDKPKEIKQEPKRKKTPKEPVGGDIDEIKASPKKKKKTSTKKHESKQKSTPGVKNDERTETPKSGSSSPEALPNSSATKANRRKSSSPRKSTGLRFSPLAIPERGSGAEQISGSSPGSEERALVQVAPVLSMKAYNSEGRPIHVKFVPVLAQSEDGEGSPGLSTDEICASIQKQALDIAARVKDELISSGVRVSSTSTENSSDYLSKVDHQSPNSKQINISPLLPGNRNSNSSAQEIDATVEENNNELICAEPLDLSISSNKNKKSNNKNTSDQSLNSNVTMEYDPENVIDITPIEYPSGRKYKNDGWVVPQRDFRKRGRPPKPMKQKVIAVGDPSRVVSSMVINVDLPQQQSETAP